jgi:hypothetical protein
LNEAVPVSWPFWATTNSPDWAASGEAGETRARATHKNLRAKDIPYS